MFKRTIIIWAIANFAVVGLVSLMAGEWYIGWHVSSLTAMYVELGLIILPNLILSIAALRYGSFATQSNTKSELGWQWNGWQSILVGIVAFVFMYLAVRIVAGFLGESIPYNMPEVSGENNGIQINNASDLLKIAGILISLLIFVALTVIGEESMFRGLIQTQIGKHYGAWIGVLIGAVLFGLRHLPNDIYYAQVWQATPGMWISRQVQLYLGAVILGLSRYFGKSTYSSAITHGLYLCVALFSL
ncbi:MAG: CPBP family intramembrane metalloprotease [Chloroflexi bacterium]|nr:MAG: CPBP family intramembrane metalloprotease [Chloroflexota bacterium]